MKSRGIFVPDLTIFQHSQAGSRAMAQAHGDIYWELEKSLLEDIKGAVDAFLLPQIVAYNFGPDAPACSWEYEPLSPAMVEWLKRLVDRMVQRGSAMPDLEELQNRLGIGIEVMAVPSPTDDPKKEDGDKDGPKLERFYRSELEFGGGIW